MHYGMNFNLFLNFGAEVENRTKSIAYKVIVTTILRKSFRFSLDEYNSKNSA